MTIIWCTYNLLFKYYLITILIDFTITSTEYTNPNCSDVIYWNYEKLSFHATDDIFRFPELHTVNPSTELHSQIMNRRVLDSIQNQKNVNRKSHLAALDPAYSNCTWLK
jgi:hypothetical protein